MRMIRRFARWTCGGTAAVSLAATSSAAAVAAAPAHVAHLPDYVYGW